MTKVAIDEYFYYKNFLRIHSWIEENCKGEVHTSPMDLGDTAAIYSFRYRIDALAFSLKYKGMR